MSRLAPITVNVEEYLGLNKYDVDEEHAHITLAEDPDPERFGELVRVCPAALYRLGEGGEPVFDYAGCLECGTCRIVAEGGVLATWEYPRPTMGVEYRYG
ncbi:MAG: ferredoxin family protein [Propionicimonas sp.]|uniref:ferredoxin family protein n=1 Tax=Propionicimonas sp. TaxID=1955623 RepID=UPI002B1F2FC7|nr:ferredoxin family protein [Propionicimonas sp.]MEA4943887.1 ferredoxin family protein [Propionicimonas sp.]MEA5053400.1 ferredoxin family protein [Propionicimonas sp.]MEA5117262.1 ferredoxin family protein [Propionicimonas sp.]